MNYLKFFHSPPSNVPQRFLVWFGKLFLCKLTQVLTIWWAVCFRKKTKKLTTLRLVNIWNWWFLLYKQFQGSEKKRFLGNHWTWRKEKHEKDQWSCWLAPALETNKMWPQVVFTHKMCSVKEGKGRRRSPRTEKKYDEPHLRDSAKEDAQISKKKCQTKSTKRENTNKMYQFLNIPIWDANSKTSTSSASDCWLWLVTIKR